MNSRRSPAAGRTRYCSAERISLVAVLTSPLLSWVPESRSPSSRSTERSSEWIELTPMMAMTRTSAMSRLIVAITLDRRLRSMLLALRELHCAAVHHTDVDLAVGHVAQGIERDRAGDALERIGGVDLDHAVPHAPAAGPRLRDHVAQEINGIVGRRGRLVRRWRVRIPRPIRRYELPVGRRVQQGDVRHRGVDALGERAGSLDPFEPVAAEHWHVDAATVGLLQDLLGLRAIARDDKELGAAVLDDPVEIGGDVGLVAEVGAFGEYLAAAPGELVHEPLPDPATVFVIEIQHGAAHQ